MTEHCCGIVGVLSRSLQEKLKCVNADSVVRIKQLSAINKSAIHTNTHTFTFFVIFNLNSCSNQKQNIFTKKLYGLITKSEQIKYYE